MDLKGKHVVIIGGSSGMGFATAHELITLGAVVTIASHSKDQVEQAASELGGVDHHVVDVTDSQSVQSMFDALDAVDHVLVTAGGYHGGKFSEIDPDLFRRAFEIRVMGAVNTAQAALPVMAPNGSITFISGVLSSRPGTGSSPTAVAGRAVETLAVALAKELAPIRVNAISPGTTDTPALGKYRNAIARRVEKNVPLKRLARPEEIAHAAIFLMGNDFVTGEVLHIDGGARW